MIRTCRLKNVVIFIQTILYVFLQIICGRKFCLQLNTDDLTWSIFFKAAGKNEKTRFFQDFLSLSR